MEWTFDELYAYDAIKFFVTCRRSFRRSTLRIHIGCISLHVHFAQDSCPFPVPLWSLPNDKVFQRFPHQPLHPRTASFCQSKDSTQIELLTPKAGPKNEKQAREILFVIKTRKVLNKHKKALRNHMKKLQTRVFGQIKLFTHPLKVTSDTHD